MEGLDDVLKNLDAFQKRAEAVDGTNEVPLPELFPDGFMRRRTGFQTFQEMLDASGLDIVSEDSFDDPRWSELVTTRTQFADWTAMQEAAAAEWLKMKLGFS